MKSRKASSKRKTRETDIRVKVDLDGKGSANIGTGIGFLDHMLELLARHSLIDIELTAKGDLQVDEHHTIEDAGICLGEALAKALGSKAGIVRYGFFNLPMDEALVSVALDLSGRPFLRYNVKLRRKKAGDLDLSVFEDFFQALANSSGITIHIDLICGRNPHHIIEAVFKGFARAMRMAVSRSGRVKGVPSTKGVL
jgi:imidazoleglycerol-phosphate dehydratase